MKSTVKDLIKRPLIGKGPDKLWPVVRERFDIGLELRRPYEQRWLLNLSFLAGKQYAFYNQGTNLLQHLVQRKGRLRVVDNKILPHYQKQVSRLIRNHPRMSVIPASTDQEDLKAAKLGDKVIKHFWRVNKMRKKIRELGGWIYSCGSGFLDDRWNSKLGPIQAKEDGKLYYLGDADCGVWSPLEVGVPAGGITDQELDLFPWMWKAKYRPLEWIQSHYPRGKEVPAETRSTPFIDASVLFGSSQNASAHKLEGATVIELKIMPCGEFPKGKFLVGSNGIILDEADHPFDTYHIEIFKDIEIPGVFWGMATTEAAIWLQKLWNRTLSDIAEFNRTMDELIDFKTSDDEAIRNFAGTVIYTGTFENSSKAKYIKLVEVNQAVTELAINSKPVGMIWYGNHTYDISPFIKEGSNKIEIKLTTTLANYCRSLTDNPTAQAWTRSYRTPFSSGLEGVAFVE